MKKIYTIAVFSAAFIIASCGGSANKKTETGTGKTETMQEEMKKPSGAPKINIKKEDLASQQDPVCGMPAFKFLKDTAVVNGKIYGFCGKGCKDEFAKNTKQYVK